MIILYFVVWLVSVCLASYVAYIQARRISGQGELTIVNDGIATNYLLQLSEEEVARLRPGDIVTVSVNVVNVAK